MTILVVDDSPIDRRLASRLLEKEGFNTRTAENGREALATLEAEPVRAVVTDLVMSGMDGLSLVGEILARHASIPVILMTAYGSDEIALRALQRGAVSYVPKRELASSLAETVRSVLSLLPANTPRDTLPESEQTQWVLGNDVDAIPRVINSIEGRLARSPVFDHGSHIQLSVALREAIVNAILHGNLEIASSLKEEDPDAHDALVRQRVELAPYRERRVRVTIEDTDDEVTLVVSDDGPGFDLALVPDPTDPMNLDRTSGRGLFLIRTFMTSVHHSDGGRTITMVKRRSGAVE